MQNENLIESTKSTSLMKTLVIVILLIVLFYYAVVVWNKNEKAKTVLDELPPTQQLAIITSKEEIKVPEISSEKNITLKDLPVYIQSLLNNQATEFLTKSVVYSNGSTGFEINYVSADTLRNTYILFHGNSKTKWPPLDGGRTAGAAFLNIENESYLIKAEFIKIEDVKTGVKVTVINK